VVDSLLLGLQGAGVGVPKHSELEPAGVVVAGDGWAQAGVGRGRGLNPTRSPCNGVLRIPLGNGTIRHSSPLPWREWLPYGSSDSSGSPVR